jgi:hypothetical protein
MKQKDIKIGATLLARVNGDMVKVIVTQERADSFSGRTKFLVSRIMPDGSHKPLQKLRASSALHPLPERSQRFEDALEAAHTSVLGPLLGKW